jgi:hypothetical protein
MAISFAFLIIDIPAGCSFFINEFLPKNFFKLAAKKCYSYMYEIKIFWLARFPLFFFLDNWFYFSHAFQFKLNELQFMLVISMHCLYVNINIFKISRIVLMHTYFSATLIYCQIEFLGLVLRHFQKHSQKLSTIGYHPGSRNQHQMLWIILFHSFLSCI